MKPELFSRREVFRIMTIGSVGTMLLPTRCAGGENGPVPAAGTASSASSTYPFELPPLRYSYEALEPHIDAQTMEIHHSRHHQGYTDKLNAALEPYPALHDRSVRELLSNLDALPEDIQNSVRNNGGGFLNHSLFWEMISPDRVSTPFGNLAAGLSESFGSIDSFKEEFASAAGSVFGSGWAWLVSDQSGGNLEVITTSNQDSPVSDGKVPVLGIDVWEHAYYLKYQNRRTDYIAAFLELVNWKVCEAHYSG